MTPPCILVVDDERLLRWALRQRLERSGYLVQEAGTGKRALELIGKGANLVLLDLRLPDASGLEILERIRKVRPDCPVILMTSWSPRETGYSVEAHGDCRILEKPFPLDELIRMVEREVGRPAPPARRRPPSEITD